MNAAWGSSQNELEALLVRAATDPAARPAFYAALVSSQLLITPIGDLPPAPGGVLTEAVTIRLGQVDVQGQSCVPVFTSPARLPSGAQWMELAARDVFNMTRGSHFVLNPGAQYGKVLAPGEVASLLDGSLLRPDSVLTIEKGAEAQIGQPADHPHDFVAALGRYFATEPCVEKAYLAQHFVASVHDEPALLLSILAPERDLERIAGEVGVIARAILPRHVAVDVARHPAGRDDYFAAQQPIYERRRRGLLARLLG